mmetsp:Transcript_120234/g.373713  ORF Transcript_120234/g.373713 Transcript_120234/m.373713 type:complete len:203 (+) Transcript_120234:103-711(+)
MSTAEGFWARRGPSLSTRHCSCTGSARRARSAEKSAPCCAQKMATGSPDFMASSSRGSRAAAAGTPVMGSTGLCVTRVLSTRWYQKTLSCSSRKGTQGPVSTVERARSVSTCASSGGTRKPPRKIWPVLSMVRCTCCRLLPFLWSLMKHSVQKRSTQSSQSTEALKCSHSRQTRPLITRLKWFRRSGRAASKAWTYMKPSSE